MPAEKVKFLEENQSFLNWWLVLILVAIIGTSLYMYFSRPASGTLFVNIGTGIACLVIFFLASAKLKLHIDSEKVALNYFPLVWQEKQWKWEEIEAARVRKYAPLADFGGWGVRRRGDTVAYTVSGSEALELTFKDGRTTVLIGTNRAKEIQEILKKLEVRATSSN